MENIILSVSTHKIMVALVLFIVFGWPLIKEIFSILSDQRDHDQVIDDLYNGPSEEEKTEKEEADRRKKKFGLKNPF